MAAVKKRNFIVLAVIILVIAIVLSSFVYLNSQKPYSGAIESITVGMQSQEINSLIYIANDQQYFNSQGLNVTIKTYPSSLAAVNDMLKGEVDISTASEFVLASEALSDQNLRAVATIDKNTQISVVGLKDRGIENISDLAGKKIGVFSNGIVEFYLGQFLEANGMNINQVTLVDYSSLNVTDALANGTFDAVIVGRSTFDNIQSVFGNSIVVWPAQNEQLSYYNAYCTQSFSVAHPELIKRFLNSLLQAEHYVIDDPEKAKAVIQNQLKYSDHIVSEIWSQNMFSVSLDQSLLSAMTAEAQWQIGNNLTNATVVPNFLDYVYLDGLLAVNPNAVTIIR
jgi:ABC-type nitrate/sulfonate/bicarbonate transport system substrate-binding protein